MYQLTSVANIVQRIADGALIPADLNNKDYVEFVAWKTAGNVPLPIPSVPVVVPSVVSRVQALLALDQAGLLTNVQSMMNGPTMDKVSKMAWDNTSEFHRNSPTVKKLAVALNLTDAQLDNLFITAAGIIV